MAGIRERLIHAYFEIDYKLVWDAIKIEIPNLKPRFQNILAELKRSEGWKLLITSYFQGIEKLLVTTALS